MGTNVKLSCSLKWLCRILSENDTLQELEDKQQLRNGSVKKLLLEPYNLGRLKKGVIDLLSDPGIYLGAYLTIHSGGNVEKKSFECLIHNLAKNGGYIVEDNDVVVNGSMLAQKKPFREASHLALLDVLMVQYASKIVTIQRTVKAARRIFTFNPSKELPSKPDVELLLTTWLNKVTQAVSDDHYTRRKRRNRKGIPTTISGDLCCALKDGRSLALLLVFYAPESFSWHDFDLDSEKLLVEREILRNIQSVFEYCNVQFGSNTFHISPVDFWQWAESGLLRCNILACLAHLFYSFEVSQPNFSLRVPPISRHMSAHSSSIQSAIGESSIMKRKRKEWLEASGSRALRRRLDCPQNGKPPSNNDGSDLTLPEINMVQFHGDPNTDSNLTSFMAPIRNSLNPTQTSVLARFKKERDLPAEVTHSLSFPFAGGHPSSAIVSSSSMGHLTPHDAGNSGESFSNQGRSLHQGGVEKLDDGDLSKRETGEEERHVCKNEEGSMEAVKTPDSPSDSPDHLVSSSGSFTVHRRHTFSSAAAAGLPVVEGNHSHHASDRRAVFQEQQQEKEENDENGVTGNSRKNTILLTHFLQLHHSHSREGVDGESTPADVELAIPPSVQNLRKKLAPILDGFNSEESNLRAKVTIELHRLLPSSSPSGDEEKSLEISKSSTFVSVAEHDDSHVDTENCAVDSRSSVATNMNSELNSRNKTGSGYQKVTASLEQFEKDEQLVLQQASPASLCENPNDMSRTCSHHEQTACKTASNQPLASNNSVEKIQRCEGSAGALANGDGNGDFSSSDTTSSDISRKHDIQTSEGAVSNTVIKYRMKGQVSSISDGDIRSTEAEVEFVTSMEASRNIPIPTEMIDGSCPVYPAKQNVEASGTKESHGSSEDSAGHDNDREPRTTDTFDSNAYSRDQVLGGTDQNEVTNRPLVVSASGESRPTEWFQRRAPTSAEGSDVRNGVMVEEEAEVSNDVTVKPSNPWVSPLHQDISTPLQKKKEQRLKQLLEERDQARKLAAVMRKSERRLKAGGDSGSLVLTGSNSSLTSAPSQNGRHEVESASSIGSEQSRSTTAFLEYSGPNCYIKPKAKTNLQIIRNAICAVCLAGDVNSSLKQNVLRALEKTTATHVLVLFRDRVGFKFRGIYSYYPGERVVSRMCGTGPREVKDTMIGALFKYNSGQKEFKEIPSRSFSISVDGLTIQNELWHSAKRKSSGKNQLF